MVDDKSTDEVINKDYYETSSSFSWLIPAITSLAVFMLLEKFWVVEWGRASKIILAVSIYLIFLKIYEYFFVAKPSSNAKAKPHPALNWPLPGPYKQWGILGKIIPYVTFYGSTLLSLINPFLIVQQLRMIIGQTRTSIRWKGKLSALTDYQCKTKYRLPFDGEWLVYNGGHTPETSHSWQVLNQRYAFDFVKADDKYNRHSGKGTKLSDYYCYRQPILAAADGEVISVENRIEDAPLVGYFVMDFLTRGIAGSHIIIKHAEGEYGLYAHLIKGSIPQKKGDRVVQGQTIGLCGHSGNSSEPHLHFHLQDKPNFFNAMGQPIQFFGVKVDGVATENKVELERGSRVLQEKKIL